MFSDSNAFLLFWLWEYTRRAEANSSEFENILAARKAPQEKELKIVDANGEVMACWPHLDWGLFSIANWGMVDGNTDLYEDGNSIIEAFIDGTFSYKYPTPDIDWPGLKRIEDKGSKETLKYNARHFNEYKLIKHIDPVIDFISSKGKGGPGGFYFLDMTRPLEELQKRLEYEYSCYKSPDDERNRENLTCDLVSQWARSRTDDSRPRRDSEIVRMLGLCMWDYVSRTQCTQEQAAEYIKEQYIERLDVKTDPFRIKRLCHFHTRTKQCIEKARFLNFS